MLDSDGDEDNNDDEGEQPSYLEDHSRQRGVAVMMDASYGSPTGVHIAAAHLAKKDSFHRRVGNGWQSDRENY